MSGISSLVCHLCDKKLASKFNLSRHLANVHSIVKPTAGARYVCPECPEKFLRHNNFVKHLEDVHSFELPVEELTFSTEDDFLNWRYALQKTSSVEYIKESKTITLVDGSRKVYLICHRLFRPNQPVKTGQRKRMLKSQGTKKTTHSCSSRIEVLYHKDLTISVKYWSKHCSHLNELGHSSLDKPTKDNIARRLQDGVSFQHILDDIRSKEPDNPRTLLLDRRDLHNVVRDYNVAHETKRHNDDGMSVKLWVEEMAQLGEESPVLFYKQQGDSHHNLDRDDFVLILMTDFQKNQILKFGTDKICIDDTHGTNGYDIHLVTLLTVDEFGTGCPVAYCFSSKCNEDYLTLFFDKVKEKVGSIRCNTFMSDDAPAFYNAWYKVMGVPGHKLLCSWHVDRCWRKHLSKVKGGKEKQEIVYKTLKVLMQSLVDEDEFRSLLAQTITNLLNDKDTREYGEYFVQYYASRPEQWAYCFRIGLGINTNMYLESFHRSLKHLYLEGKKVKRLDKTINAVMKMARDSLFKRLIKLAKQSPSERVLLINKSHKASEAIGPSALTVVKEGEEWHVTSSNGVEHYIITKSQTVCEDGCMRCSLCNICIHSFKCSCHDNVIKMNICKHIHACCRVFDLAGPEISCENNVNNVNTLIAQTKVNTNVAKSQQLINKASSILDLLNKSRLSDDDCKSVERKLDGAISLLNSLSGKKLECKGKINTNSNIVPQVRLFSVKKKAISLKRLNKPTFNESINIIQGLTCNSQVVMNVHTGNDHTYNVNDKC